MLRTQRSRQFPKPQKSAIFGIIAKNGLHEKCFEAEIVEMAESVILCVKCGADHGGAMEKWLRPLFVEL